MENYAQEQLMFKNYKHDNKTLLRWIIPLAIIAALLGLWALLSNKEHNDIVHLEMTLKSPSPKQKYDKCIAAVSECIIKKELGNAEYYIKSYHHPRSIMNSVSTLEQAYIDEGYVEKAINLFNWASTQLSDHGYDDEEYSNICSPLYYYYMDINEYSLAEEYIATNLKKGRGYDSDTPYPGYYQHLERCVRKMILMGEREKAKSFIKTHSSFFNDVSKGSEYYKEKVINKLMTLTNE